MPVDFHAPFLAKPLRLVSATQPRSANCAMKTNSQALILPAQPSGSNAPAADIHGIKPPVEIASVWFWIWLGIICVALGVAAYYWWRWYNRKRLQPKATIVIPPHKRAKDKLTRALDLIHEPYLFCSLVSDTLREYLEERFDLHAPERTTEEFLAELRSSTVLNEAQKERLEAFLTQCDLVKFARAEPVESELRALHGAAFSLIEETEPLALVSEIVPTEPVAKS